MTDQEFYDELLDRLGFVDGGEVTADGSAHNDLVHEKVGDVLALIRQLGGRA